MEISNDEIHLYSDNNNSTKLIVIKSQLNASKAYTSGNVIQKDVAIITLGTQWSESARNGTALHELLHALGVHHEHKRNDRKKFGIKLNEKRCKEKYGKD